MTQAAYTELSKADFERIYVSVTKEEGGYFEYEEIKDAPKNLVWSVIEGDEEVLCHDGEYRSHLYAVPGIHHVNLIGFIKTENPWQDESVTAIYFGARD